MQKHDFEKQVQEKLEELSLTPSAPVWQKVEEQIRKKKDKRRIIFWLLPLLLTGVGIAGYFSFHPIQTTKKNKGLVNRSILQPSHAVAEPHSNTTELKTQKENKPSQPVDETTISTQKPVASLTPSHHFNASLTSVTEKNNGDPPTIQEINNTSGEAELLSKIVATNSYTEPVDVISVSIDKDSLLLLKPVTPLKTTINNAIVASNHYKEKKWQWGAFAYIGSSSVQNGLVDAINRDKSADLYMNPAPTGSGTGNFTLPPSPTTKGWAIAIGVDVKRKISNRTFLSTGIHYAYYSTHIYVGQKIRDSSSISQNLYDASRNFSNTNRTYNYQNRYHFIEVPININYRLLKQAPLYVHTGISIVRLVKSHALYYDPSRNLYYQTNRYLNKTQFNWMAGITYQFSVTNHLLVEAGPQIQYGLRPLQQQNGQEKLHLFSSGIRINISLK